MDNKYKALNQLECSISQYIYREIKRKNRYQTNMFFIVFSDSEKRYILNNVKNLIESFFKLDDNNDIIKDIITLTCDVGKITINDLIDDFNYIRSKVFLEPLNEPQFIEYIKTKLSPYYVVTDLINMLFTWKESKRGFNFYALLRTNLNSTLKINKLIDDYLF